MADDPVPRFRLSIQLEATHRALDDRWARQVAVWTCSYFEVLALTAVAGVHLVTSPYSTGVFLLLMFVISACQAGNVFDPLFWPVHLIRPKNHSRFGLSEHPKGTRRFFTASVLIRLTCSSILLFLLMDLLLWNAKSLCGFQLYFQVDPQRYHSEMAKCQASNVAGGGGSSKCSGLLSFDARCHNETMWSSWLRQQALSGGLPCDGDRALLGSYYYYGYGDTQPSTTQIEGSQLQGVAQLVSDLNADQLENEYCEYMNGTTFPCYPVVREPFAILWTSRQIPLDDICPSWELHSYNYTYFCYASIDDAEHCKGGLASYSLLESTSQLNACGPLECLNSIPQWLSAILTVEAQSHFCKCKACKPWYSQNVCTLMAVNEAYRARAGVEALDFSASSLINLQFYLRDPTYAIQLIAALFMVASPVFSLLVLALYWLRGGNPVVTPANLELQERVEQEELVIAAELRSTGTVVQRTPFICCASSKIEGNFNRLVMLFEIAFYVVDVVLDLQMIVLYFQKHHYWFAAVQTCIVVRSVLDFVVRHVIFGQRLVYEIIDSFKANLRTDVFLTILQSEKTGEAVLSFILQTYALFYMGDEILAYWTALLSLLISARGIAQGCYIHFDLAVVAGGRSTPSRAPSVVPVDGEFETDAGHSQSVLPAVSILPTPLEAIGGTGGSSGPLRVESVQEPKHGPPMMDFEQNEEEDKDCADGAMCAQVENPLGENLEPAENNETNDSAAAPVLIGKGVSVIVPL